MRAEDFADLALRPGILPASSRMRISAPGDWPADRAGLLQRILAEVAKVTGPDSVPP
jgi:hypothetical protein